MAFSMDTKGFLKEIKEAYPQLVFNLVESVEGHGRLIHFPASILDLLSIPYTGAPADALYLTSSKILTKKILEGAAIATPPYYSPGDLKAKGISLKGPYIIKSVWEHASVGLEESSVLSVKSSGQLLAEMEKRRDPLGGDCFAEQFIDGREFNLSCLASQEDPEVLPPAEMRFIDYPPEMESGGIPGQVGRVVLRVFTHPAEFRVSQVREALAAKPDGHSEEMLASLRFARLRSGGFQSG